MIIHKILRNTSLALIFIIPFVALLAPSDPGAQVSANNLYFFANHLFFPFITSKAFVFRILVEIVVALWIALMLRDRKYAPTYSPITLAVTAFTIFALIADLAGVNPLRSLWSNFERMEGWMIIVHLWVYFLAITSIFAAHGKESSRRLWHRFLNTNIIVALCVGLYGILQLNHVVKIHQGSTRIDASLGNAAYLAVFMLIHTFIAIYMSFLERSRKHITWSWIYSAGAVFFAYLVFETSTRGTILGLIAGLMLSLAIYAIFGKHHSNKSRGISGGIIIALILLVILFYANKNLPFIQKNETLRRLSEISINDTSTQARGLIWPMAIKGAFQTPKTAILGWGQENFNYVFNENYNPAMWTQEQWFDRAHSVYLDWLIAGGLIGFLLYISLFVAALYALWKSDLVFVEKTVLTGLLAAYAVHNVFVFDNQISYMLFFTVLAFVHSIAPAKQLAVLQVNEKKTEEAIVVRDYIYMPIVAVVFLLTLYFVNVRPIQANTRLIAALNACGNQPSESLAPAAFKKALAMNQYVANQEAREQLLQCSVNVVRGNTASQPVKDELYTLTVSEIANQLKATPQDARAFVFGGGFYDMIGNWDAARPLLEKAHELSPLKQTIDIELAGNYMNSGKEKEAVDLLAKAYASAPEDTQVYAPYAAALIINGQNAKAHELFATSTDVFTNPYVISAYLKAKLYPNAIEAYKTLIAKNPENIQYYASLASTYLTIGLRSEALAELELMKTKFPLAKDQIDAAIKEVKAGKNPLQ